MTESRSLGLITMPFPVPTTMRDAHIWGVVEVIEDTTDGVPSLRYARRDAAPDAQRITKPEADVRRAQLEQQRLDRSSAEAVRRDQLALPL